MNFFKKLTSGLKKSSDKLSEGLKDVFTKKRVDERTLEELEELLISSDLGMLASAYIITEFRKKKLDKDVDEKEIKQELATDIEQILKPCEDILEIKDSPCIILMVGVNGAGKTTTIGKLASQLKASGKQVSLIAGDTFRAAAVEQLVAWGKKSGIRVFAGLNNADAAGVVYDGIKEAVSLKDDVVLIDTAGRLQNKAHLMDELKKIVKVIAKLIPGAPHETILTIDATTGLNAIEQVKVFKTAVDINGLTITKLDGTSKGGVLVSIALECRLPILYIGIGEAIDDLDTFSAKEFAKNLVGI